MVNNLSIFIMEPWTESLLDRDEECFFNNSMWSFLLYIKTAKEIKKNVSI